MKLNEYNSENKRTVSSPGQVLGSSKAIRPVVEKIKKVASSDFSVLLEGEAGVGKTLAARTIHQLSNRQNRPFIKVDIAAIPETLLESELFGYKKGAFTGANNDKKGFFEAANGGTLFLDELENLPAYAQSKLLGVVEDRSVVPLGTTTPVKIDVRIVSATNKNLKQAVIEKSFREDLYFRLCEFDIRIPPLRERPEDIHELSLEFLRQAAAELGKQVTGITNEAMDLLSRYPWPGNVRELKNAIRRAVLLCEDDNLTPMDFPLLLRAQAKTHNKPRANNEVDYFPNTLLLAELEQWAIRQALTITKGKAMKAAIMVGMEYQKFKRKLKKYAIQL
jgi:DNA-binding NtrC family response regulator